VDKNRRYLCHLSESAALGILECVMWMQDIRCSNGGRRMLVIKGTRVCRSEKLNE
jgi:hypothetical protein